MTFITIVRKKKYDSKAKLLFIDRENLTYETETNEVC